MSETEQGRRWKLKGSRSYKPGLFSGPPLKLGEEVEVTEYRPTLLDLSEEQTDLLLGALDPYAADEARDLLRAHKANLEGTEPWLI